MELHQRRSLTLVVIDSLEYPTQRLVFVYKEDHSFLYLHRQHLLIIVIIEEHIKCLIESHLFHSSLEYFKFQWNN